MPDIFTPEKRSKIMSKIHSKDTSIEVQVRKWLFKRGFRYRVNVNILPGKPDIVMPKYKTIIFVHGCYWHGHDTGCSYSHTPKSNTDYWGPKITKNKVRDQKNEELLEQMGWKVIALWECQIRKDFSKTMENVVEALTTQTS